MKTANKKAATLSPLMQPREKRKTITTRLIGAISKARAREWIRHVNKSRRDWN